jgi:ArsR family transcriptional regulator
MDMSNAITALSALAHEGRLRVFRLLVEAGPEGLAAGEIGRRLGVLPNTLSAGLTVLSHAGLVRSRRDGRSIIYAAEFDRMAGLLSYLVEDCCNGRPEVCAPLSQIAAKAAACATACPASGVMED